MKFKIGDIVDHTNPACDSAPRTITEIEDDKYWYTIQDHGNPTSYWASEAELVLFPRTKVNSLKKHRIGSCITKISN